MQGFVVRLWEEADFMKAIGRADTPIMQERPLVPKKPPEHLTGDKASQVLNEVEARLNLLNGSMLEILDIHHGGCTNHGRRYEAISAIKKLRLPDKIEGIEQDIYQKVKRGCMWIHRLQKKNVEKLINIVGVAKKQRSAQLRKEAAHGFSEWVSNAFKKGAGAPQMDHAEKESPSAAHHVQDRKWSDTLGT